MLTSTDTGYGNTEIWIKYDNLTEFLGFYILAIKSYNISRYHFSRSSAHILFDISSSSNHIVYLVWEVIYLIQGFFHLWSYCFSGLELNFFKCKGSYRWNLQDCILPASPWRTLVHGFYFYFLIFRSNYIEMELKINLVLYVKM